MLTVEYLPAPKDLAVVGNGDSKWTLNHAASGSGARYEGGGVLVWNKGPEVTFERDGKSMTCNETK